MINLFLSLCITFSSPEFNGDSLSRPDSLNPRRLAVAVGSQTVFYVSGVSFLQFYWYRGHDRAPLHFYDDSKGWMQLDKAGHMYGAYYESYIGYHMLRWAGVPEKKALWFGGPLGLLLQTPIEVFDGLYDGYGFSPTDMIANTAGSALFMVQQGIWHDQIIRMKFSYAPSGYPKYRPAYFGEKELERFFLDYNGHTYWLSGNLAQLTGWKLPPWLNLAAGYSANGMLGEFKNPLFSRGVPIPHTERYRQYLLAPDIDLSKIRTRKKWLKPILSSLNLIKVPLPALEYNKVQGFRLRPLYF